MSEIFPFNLNHLRYFHEVARAGNMRRAATRLGVSQPALSKQIQALEDATELQLFYRSSKGLTPTPDGEVVFGHCERIFGHVRDLEDAAEALRTGSAGRLTIGTIVSIGTYLLPRYVAAFRRAYPQIRLRITTTRSSEVLQALREHRIDVGYIAGPSDDPALEATAVLQERLVLVVNPAHEMASGGPWDAAALARLDRVAFDEEAPTRRLTDEYFERQKVETVIAAECPNLETIKRLVRQGVGFAVVPCHSVVDEIANGQLRELPIKGWDLSRQLYAVHLKHGRQAPAVRHFIESAAALA